MERGNRNISIIAVICLCTAALFFVASLITFQVADASVKPVEQTVFGIGSERSEITSSVGVLSVDNYTNTANDVKGNLESTSSRDINVAVQKIVARREAEAKAAAEALKQAENAYIGNVKQRRATFEEVFGMPEDLSEINWDIGRDAFVVEWTARINNYFKGTPLADKGEVFAVTAWEVGIDPRWSAAISNTESSKGLYCFLPHNAWGWGDRSWENWDDAIKEHIIGLSSKYGYTIAVPLAQKYCPPNWENWYNNTLEQMRKI